MKANFCLTVFHSFIHSFMQVAFIWICHMSGNLMVRRDRDESEALPSSISFEPAGEGYVCERHSHIAQRGPMYLGTTFFWTEGDHAHIIVLCWLSNFFSQLIPLMFPEGRSCLLETSQLGIRHSDFSAFTRPTVASSLCQTS